MTAASQWSLNLQYFVQALIMAGLGIVGDLTL